MATIETKAYSLGHVANPIVADAAAVTPSDAVDLTTIARGLYIGGAGAVKVKLASDAEITFSGVAAGTILPVVAKRVFLTGTTATNIIALF